MTAAGKVWFGDHPADEVEDPYGGSLGQYQATAAELAQLTAQLARLLWPDDVAGPDASA